MGPVKSVPNASEKEVIASAYEPVPNGAGGVNYVPVGKQTIGLQDIQQRFRKFGLGLSAQVDERLKSLAKYSNP